MESSALIPTIRLHDHLSIPDSIKSHYRRCRFLFRLLHISFNFIGRKERRRLQNRPSMPIWMLPNQLLVFLRFDCDDIAIMFLLARFSLLRAREAGEGEVELITILLLKESRSTEKSDKKIESDSTAMIHNHKKVVYFSIKTLCSSELCGTRRHSSPNSLT